MRVKHVAPYTGPQDEDGLVTVYDITVNPRNLYTVLNVLVSNSKRISMLDVNALLSHGAVNTLQDAGAYRGQANPQVWLQFMMGYNPTTPRVPMVYEKFFNQLKASGINAVREGYQTQVMALTNKDVAQMAGDRVIKKGDTVHWDKDLKPVAGGLFDPQLTGGHNGRRWSAIELPEPMPNPVMEEPIRRILGLTQKNFLGVISGEHQLENGDTGPRAIKKALENIDLDRELRKAKGQWEGGKGQKKDDALRKWHYLEDAKKLGLHPKDWMLDKVPVLPPAFRPVSVMGDSGTPLVNDANYLYKELLDSVENHRKMKEHLGEGDIGAERAAIYHSFKAVTGLGDPIHPKLQEKGVKGILKSIFGSSPKFGTVQRKLLSSTVDNVGRATIIPNPDFDMDTVGIPENQAYDVYSKFIVRRLRRRGLPIREALRHVNDKSELANSILQEEMNDRPVYINRAPVLHKFGIMAFKPKLVKGDVLQVSPMIVKGFNADFDGDAMQFHVPTTDSAIKEAYERMLPSRSILSPADFKTPVNVPGQEYLGGLHHATRQHDKNTNLRPRVFRSRKDALAAYERGEISAETPIHVVED
jgi:DNA-directed RNA polymerase beta' subunit